MDLDGLRAQAGVARDLAPDVVEWRADGYADLTVAALLAAAREARAVLGALPILFTLRAAEEGGLQPLSADARAELAGAVLDSGLVDLVDMELCNGRAYLDPLMARARANGVRVILSFHDFQATPNSEALLGTIAAMVEQGCDIAKFACMPRTREDVLRLLQVTSTARDLYPAVPLCTMAMGGLGALTRVAGFLFGSDMAFAVGQVVSAPGQIPLAQARALTKGLLG
jgi:3-dehydroquinate dehydratase-1